VVLRSKKKECLKQHSFFCLLPYSFSLILCVTQNLPVLYPIIEDIANNKQATTVGSLSNITINAITSAAINSTKARKAIFIRVASFNFSPQLVRVIIKTVSQINNKAIPDTAEKNKYFLISPQNLKKTYVENSFLSNYLRYILLHI